jgi:hypothetical protein
LRNTDSKTEKIHPRIRFTRKPEIDCGTANTRECEKCLRGKGNGGRRRIGVITLYAINCPMRYTY